MYSIKLDMNFNNIGPEGAKAISEALKENTMLTTIGLSLINRDE
jgi:hypothetical protein